MKKHRIRVLSILLPVMMLTGCSMSQSINESAKMSEANVSSTKEYIKAAIEDAGITDDMSDYDKCVAINNYICSVVEYSSDTGNEIWMDSDKSGTSDYCLVLGYGNCAGYAEAFKSMCSALDIECYICEGATTVSFHEWNYVVIDDAGYYVDVSWNDNVEQNGYLMSAEGWEDHVVDIMR